MSVLSVLIPNTPISLSPLVPPWSGPLSSLHEPLHGVQMGSYFYFIVALSPYSELLTTQV